MSSLLTWLKDYWVVLGKIGTVLAAMVTFMLRPRLYITKPDFELHDPCGDTSVFIRAKVQNCGFLTAQDCRVFVESITFMDSRADDGSGRLDGSQRLQRYDARLSIADHRSPLEWRAASGDVYAPTTIERGRINAKFFHVARVGVDSNIFKVTNNCISAREDDYQYSQEGIYRIVVVATARLALSARRSIDVLFSRGSKSFLEPLPGARGTYRFNSRF